MRGWTRASTRTSTRSRTSSDSRALPVADVRRQLERAVLTGKQRPLMTPPDRVPPAALGAIGYRKPAAVLLALRNHVVGRTTFDRAFREYTRRWAFKHPTPADFFRTMESSTGEDLAWFWRGFWYTNDVLDIGIDSASTLSSDGRNVAIIRFGSTRRSRSPSTPAQARRWYHSGREAPRRRVVPGRPLHCHYSREVTACGSPPLARRYGSGFQCAERHVGKRAERGQTRPRHYGRARNLSGYTTLGRSWRCGGEIVGDVCHAAPLPIRLQSPDADAPQMNSDRFPVRTGHRHLIAAAHVRHFSIG